MTSANNIFTIVPLPPKFLSINFDAHGCRSSKFLVVSRNQSNHAKVTRRTLLVSLYSRTILTRLTIGGPIISERQWPSTSSFKSIRSFYFWQSAGVYEWQDFHLLAWAEQIPNATSIKETFTSRSREWRSTTGSVWTEREWDDLCWVFWWADEDEDFLFVGDNRNNYWCATEYF